MKTRPRFDSGRLNQHRVELKTEVTVYDMSDLYSYCWEVERTWAAEAPRDVYWGAEN